MFLSYIIEGVFEAFKGADVLAVFIKRIFIFGFEGYCRCFFKKRQERRRFNEAF